MGSTKHSFIISVTGNKYCINIARQHKSNNIYFVVVPSQYYFIKKCTDCQGYESNHINLNPKLFFTTAIQKQAYSNIRKKYSIQ